MEVKKRVVTQKTGLVEEGQNGLEEEGGNAVSAKGSGKMWMRPVKKENIKRSRGVSFKDCGETTEEEKGGGERSIVTQAILLWLEVLKKKVS